MFKGYFRKINTVLFLEIFAIHGDGLSVGINCSWTKTADFRQVDSEIITYIFPEILFEVSIPCHSLPPEEQSQ